MGNVVIVKTTQNMDYCVHFADIGQKLVAQPLAFRSSFDQTGNVDKLKLRRRHRFRLNDFRQFLQPRVRHRHPSGVRLNGTKRKVGGLRRDCPRQCIKQSRFADVRQTDDSAIKSHKKLL